MTGQVLQDISGGYESGTVPAVWRWHCYLK